MRVQTLRGEAHYADIGYTATERDLIRAAMARCDSPGLHLTGAPPPPVRKPRPRNPLGTNAIGAQLRDLADQLDRLLEDPDS